MASTAEPIELRALDWFRTNRRQATIGSVVVAVLALVAAGWWSNRNETESRAERALGSARVSAEAGNLALATSDLARVVSTYGGTRAAEEATMLLAQVRLVQNQAALAVTDLRRFLSAGPRPEFKGPANGLLGAALEETGQFSEALKAYQAAVEATPYQGIKAQYLLDAARSANAAGDTAQAATIYERVATDFRGTPSSIEAEVRIGELRRTGFVAPKGR